MPLVLLAFAVAALGSSAYLASFCLLLENECHLHHGGACERLELYFSGAVAMMAFAFVAGAGSAWTYALARREALPR